MDKPQTTAPPTPSPNAPGVHNPAQLPPAPVLNSPGPAGRNVNGLVFNLIIPGLGSLIAGDLRGLAMIGLLVAAVILMVVRPKIGIPVGAMMIIGAWIWSIVAGVKLLSSSSELNSPGWKNPPT